MSLKRQQRQMNNLHISVNKKVMNMVKRSIKDNINLNLRQTVKATKLKAISKA